jgi:hypothetical protein
VPDVPGADRPVAEHRGDRGVVGEGREARTEGTQNTAKREEEERKVQRAWLAERSVTWWWVVGVPADTRPLCAELPGAAVIFA